LKALTLTHGLPQQLLPSQQQQQQQQQQQLLTARRVPSIQHLVC
jgi:hypothetical protein